MNHPYNSPVRVPRFRNLVFVVEESLGTDDIYFILFIHHKSQVQVQIRKLRSVNRGRGSVQRSYWFSTQSF